MNVCGLAALDQGGCAAVLESDACTLADARQRVSALDVSYGEYVAAPLTRWRIALEMVTADGGEGLTLNHEQWLALAQARAHG